MIYGANKPHNVAVVVLDQEAVQKWSESQGVALGDATKNERVKKLIGQELEKFGSGFKNFEKPKDFILVTEDFTVDNDMLTPKMSLKRRNVVQKYESKLLALY
jgi:long-chain acyl-CoA synthetase